eukprot:TRINITY_DN15847_c0_g1_i1.p2 TRINITY_DN15847_c0_g1~~TRINITY_DN15847_c0_g1_i1.p2  ORF type:complete len:951 (+),score=454.66 TRINITY_DN15847_c0_g1_i1:55-2853(+)
MGAARRCAGSMPAHESLAAQAMRAAASERAQQRRGAKARGGHDGDGVLQDMRRELARVVRENRELHGDALRTHQEQERVGKGLRDELRRMERRAQEAEHAAAALQRKVRTQERELDQRRQQLDGVLAKARLYADHPAVQQQGMTVSAALPVAPINASPPSQPPLASSVVRREAVVVAALQRKADSLAQELAAQREENAALADRLRREAQGAQATGADAERLYGILSDRGAAESETALQLLNAQLTELNRELEATRGELTEERRAASETAGQLAEATLREKAAYAQARSLADELAALRAEGAQRLGPDTLGHPLPADPSFADTTVTEATASPAASPGRPGRGAAEAEAPPRDPAAAAALAARVAAAEERAEREAGEAARAREAAAAAEAEAAQAKGQAGALLRDSIALQQRVNDLLEEQEAMRGELRALRKQLAHPPPQPPPPAPPTPAPSTVADAACGAGSPRGADTGEAAVQTAPCAAAAAAEPPAQMQAPKEGVSDAVLADLLSARQAVRDLSGEKDVLSLRLDDAEIALAAAQAERRAALDDAESLRLELRNSQQEHAATQSRLRSAEQLLAREEAARKELEQQVRQLEEDRRYHVGEIMGASDDFKQLLSEKSLTALKLQEAVAEREGIKQELDAALGRAAQCEHSLRAKEHELADVMVAYRQLGEEQERLVLTVRNCERELLREREEKQERERDLANEREELRRLAAREQQLLVDLQSMQYEHDALARRALAFQTSAKEAERQQQELRAIAAQEQRARRDEERRRGEVERETSLAANEVTHLRARSEEAQLHYAGLQRQLEQEQRRTRDLEEELSHAHVRNMRLSEQTAHAAQEADSLRATLRDLEDRRAAAEERERQLALQHTRAERGEEDLKAALSRERAARAMAEQAAERLRLENEDLLRRADAGLCVVEVQDEAMRRARQGGR